MVNYNQTTQEITRPSELLVALRSYTASLQSLSSYINVDVTRLVKSVLLQQTMPQDSRGSPTITTLYSNWFVSLCRGFNDRNLLSPLPCTVQSNKYTLNKKSDHNKTKVLMNMPGPGITENCPACNLHVGTSLPEPMQNEKSWGWRNWGTN